MNTDLKIQIKTLTPLWTGGVDGSCDRLHETGIIGSLRWWYEAIVRGLGGYACDPTGDRQCKLNWKEKDEGDRKKNMCPVCYLFGCTGWKRRFQLQIEVAPLVPLHFRTLSNKRWLGEIFVNIDNLKVPYGNIEFRLIINENNKGDLFIQSQLMMLLEFIAAYGGLGAKLQYGFGQISNPEIYGEKEVFQKGLDSLKAAIKRKEFKPDIKQVNTIYDINNFICMEYEIPGHKFAKFLYPSSHFGNYFLIDERKYIPCVFDLRYKNKENWGMRQWLKGKEGWFESDDPKKWGTIDKLLGPRSQWKIKGKTVFIHDDYRMASRLCFGMPHQLTNGSYHLKIYGFAPSDINISGENMTPESLNRLCQEYISYIIKIEHPANRHLGKDIIKTSGGGSK